jgi:DNA-binding ferritin-like protein
LIAEHVRYLDSYVPGSMERFLELADIEEAVDNIPSALSMMTQLKLDNDRYIIHLRAGVAAAEQANEPAVGQFLTRPSWCSSKEGMDVEKYY